MSESHTHDEDHAVSLFIATCHKQVQSLVEQLLQIRNAAVNHTVSPYKATYRKQEQSLVEQMLSQMRG